MRARVVEAGEQNQRAIADVAVLVEATAVSSTGTACAAGVRRIVREALVRVS
jgi:hypothetical protein